MLKLRIFASGDVSLNIGKASFDAIAEFLEFVEVNDERVDFFVNVVRFVDLFIDCAIGIYDSDSGRFVFCQFA